jgi:hypothetical protein
LRPSSSSLETEGTRSIPERSLCTLSPIWTIAGRGAGG